MPRIRLLMIAVLVACIAPAAIAQQTIQQQMSAEEFRSAGLDKLSAEELAALNRWLQRQVQEETTVVAEQAREEGRQQARQEAEAASTRSGGGGLFDGSGEAFQSSIVGEFAGFGRGHRYALENGQVWEQIDAARLDGVRRTNPAVTVNPGMLGSWYLRVDGYNTRAKVRRIE